MAIEWTSQDGKINALQRLTIDNVQEYFKKEYSRWLFRNSHEVIVDGEKVEKLEREMIMLQTKKTDIKKVEVSGTTSKGFPLTEHDFIQEQLKRYEPKYEKTVGDQKNIEFNKTVKFYIDFLKAKLEDKKADDYSKLWKEIVPKYIKNLSLSDFNEIMTYKRLPNGKDKLTWEGKKTWCLHLFRSHGFTTAQVNKVFDGGFRANLLGRRIPDKDFRKLLGNHKY